MIYIEGIEFNVNPMTYTAATLADISHEYPRFIREGGTATFQGFLIAVVKQCQEQNSTMKERHYSEWISEFVRIITMKKFQQLVDSYAHLRPKKKKEEK